jgi:hypothetical protein
MVDLKELEELFKSKTFSRNPAMVNALLRNAALLHDPNATEEQKAIALENVKSISQFGTLPKTPKQKKVEGSEVQPKIKQPVSKKPVENQPVKTAQPIKQAEPEYHPDLSTHNITPDMWKLMPLEHKLATIQYHKETSAPKNPQPAAVKPEPPLPSNVIQFKPKIKKSLDSLYSIFEYIKKNISTSKNSDTDSTSTN